ncbi:DUF106 domain-containing protein [Candidatus Woesearchaeota archaeon]|nr:DUF106 domain-containing protein [Candidatus Woesearchaeota archaeon]
MAWFSFLDPVMNFLLGWMLNFSPFVSILLLSVALSLFITLVYKYTTNQSLMKDLKDELKAFQQQMKELKHDPNAMMDVNKKAMETNLKYMTHSFKPMLFTFLPIILIFGWLNAHFAYEPIHPGQEFTMTVAFDKTAIGGISVLAPDGLLVTSDETKTVTDGNAIFTLKGEAEGIYPVGFSFNNQTYTKEVRISQARSYIEPLLVVNDGSIKSITTTHEKTKVIKIGSFGITWLWSYIIFSLVFSIAMRKMLKVY